MNNKNRTFVIFKMFGIQENEARDHNNQAAYKFWFGLV